jgi:hypothetical protein
MRIEIGGALIVNNDALTAPEIKKTCIDFVFG